jgi:hypothetical protein
VTQVELQAMKELYQKWKINRSSSQMGFLSKVDPFMAESAKTYFILKKNSSPEIFAFLTGLPVLPKKGMYFSDWIRPIQTKPGIMEYLLIESMRILFSNHYKEVRLGIAPLAHLSSDDFKGVRKKLYFKLMQTCFHKLKYPYSFNGLFQFKSKLEPTSWEKLFIATDKKIGLKQLFDLYSVHFKVSFVESFYNNMREKYLTRHTHLVAPKSISDLTNRIKATLVITLSMLALHLVTQFFDFASNWHAKSGFVANGFNYFGYITGPVFHDNTYHLLGDLGTFLLLGGLVELYLGMPVLLILTTLGFWATNPIAIELLKFVNEFNLLSSDSFYKTLLERDYGSSNAIYAFAGALALLTVRPNFILIPFIINGFLICLGRGSYLAIHHWVGLFLGVAFLKFYHLYKAR